MSQKLEQFKAALVAQGMVCRGPLPEADRKAVALLLRQGDMEGARKLDIAARRAACLKLLKRPTCGHNFGKIVAAGPLDGQEHKYKCPVCGAEGTYRAPFFSEEAA